MICLFFACFGFKAISCSDNFLVWSLAYCFDSCSWIFTSLTCEFSPPTLTLACWLDLYCLPWPCLANLWLSIMLQSLCSFLQSSLPQSPTPASCYVILTVTSKVYLGAPTWKYPFHLCLPFKCTWDSYICSRHFCKKKQSNPLSIDVNFLSGFSWSFSTYKPIWYLYIIFCCWCCCFYACCSLQSLPPLLSFPSFLPSKKIYT